MLLVTGLFLLVLLGLLVVLLILLVLLLVLLIHNIASVYCYAVLRRGSMPCLSGFILRLK